MKRYRLRSFSEVRGINLTTVDGEFLIRKLQDEIRQPE